MCSSDLDFADLTEHHILFDERVLSSALDLQDALIRRLLVQLRRELMAPGFASSALLDAYAMALIVETGRYLGSRAERPALCASLVPWQERRVRDRLAVDGPAPRVAELAALCGVGVRHFARLYKSATGETVTETIARKQIHRAKQTLMETDLPIKLVAAQLGFQGANAFAAAFKRALGCTPSQYRQQHRRCLTPETF